MGSRQNGAIAEAEVCKKLYDLGAIVSSPDYYNAKYDLVADINEKLFRVQVKRSYPNNGKENSVTVELRQTSKSGKKNTYSNDDFDALCVYIPDIDSVCWFYNEEVSVNQLNINLCKESEIRECNKSRVNHYSDYLITERLK